MSGSELSNLPWPPLPQAVQHEVPPPIALISNTVKRLCWTIQGPINSSIFVMPRASTQTRRARPISDKRSPARPGTQSNKSP